jgi:hypothetical protein
VALCRCDPAPYDSESNGSSNGGDDGEATVEWLESTFAGFYQLDSYHISDDSCSVAGLNRRSEAGEFFWVHADTSGGVFAEMCVCGNTLEQCQSFADAVERGDQVICTLQRIVTDRTSSNTAAQRIDIAGTWDGANNCVQGGAESVTFERNGNQIEIDHQTTLTTYVVVDGLCTPARGGVAAQGVPCTSRDKISGSLIAD